MAMDFSTNLHFINNLSRNVRSCSLNCSLTARGDLFTLEVILFHQIMWGHPATVR